MKKIVQSFIVIFLSINAHAATLFDKEIDQVQQYGADALTIVYLKSEYASPNNCTNSIWGKKAVLIRSDDAHSEKLLSVALAAMMAGKKVDIGLVNSCDGVTEKVHYIKIKK
ncbi:hypothetical protein [Aliikangiella sp. IMCC44359]|uniref:hypothetical protein n=1 Tax=Aliikangiella sp. IMCC44359 TaxID=3459125 RepID=UPI00403A7E70